MNEPIVTVHMDLKAVKALEAVVKGCREEDVHGNVIDRATDIFIEARDSILSKPAGDDEILAWKLLQMGESLTAFMVDDRINRRASYLKRQRPPPGGLLF